jgi:hypothetical protein
VPGSGLEDSRPPVAARTSQPRARRAVLAAFAFTTVYFTGLFPPVRNPNELSRVEAVVAFVEDGTFSIDSALRRYGNHEDKSVSEGRVYSNKAPGLIFGAIPVYRLLRSLFPQPASAADPVFVLLRFLTVSLVSILALARFGARVAGEQKGAPPALLMVALSFGTPFLYYARSLFSHAWSASLLFLAWDRIRAAEEKQGRSAISLAIAGFLAGAAAISEYLVAPIALLLALRAALGLGGQALLPFAAGAALPLASLALYNEACFGSPWVLSSAREAHPEFAEMSRRGAFGFGLPRPGTVAALLFHPGRGALLFSPFWLWAVPGWGRWWRSGHRRLDCLFSLAAFLLLLLFASAYPNWHGGWCLGSRYLLPALFFGGLALVHALRGPVSRGLFLVAVAFSFAHFLLLTAAYPHSPLMMPWPAATVGVWFLSRGVVAPNLGSLAGLPPLLSLLPAVLTAAAALAFALAGFGTRPRQGIAAALGLLAFLSTLLLPLTVYRAEVAWRAGMYEQLRTEN